VLLKLLCKNNILHGGIVAITGNKNPVCQLADGILIIFFCSD